MYRVKPLRLGNFRTVLEMLEDGAAEDGQHPLAPRQKVPGGSWRSSDQVQYAFDHMAETRAYVPLDRLSALYRDAQPADGTASGKQRPREMPRRKSDKEAVGEELHLHAALTGSDLRRIRRDFARRNHPDRVPPWRRDEATRRMTIANALIDGALKERAALGRF